MFAKGPLKTPTMCCECAENEKVIPDDDETHSRLRFVSPVDQREILLQRLYQVRL